MKAAFGDRQAHNWKLFIKGVHLTMLISEFRSEYVMLLKSKLQNMSHSTLGMKPFAESISIPVNSHVAEPTTKRIDDDVHTPKSYAAVVSKGGLAVPSARHSNSSPSPSKRFDIPAEVIKPIARRPSVNRGAPNTPTSTSPSASMKNTETHLLRLNRLTAGTLSDGSQHQSSDDDDNVVVASIFERAKKRNIKSSGRPLTASTSLPLSTALSAIKQGKQPAQSVKSKGDKRRVCRSCRRVIMPLTDCVLSVPHELIQAVDTAVENVDPANTSYDMVNVDIVLLDGTRRNAVGPAISPLATITPPQLRHKAKKTKLTPEFSSNSRTQTQAPASSSLVLSSDEADGEGTSPKNRDNASSNRTAAQRLFDRLLDEVNYDVDPEHFVGCMCHIVNLAAQAFLKAEVTLEEEDYPRRDDAEIPVIRVIGDSALWQAKDADQDNLQLEDETEDEAECSRQPDTDRESALTVADSTQADTFTKDTFRALEAIQPALRSFTTLTARYSTIESIANRILLDLHLAIQNLSQMQLRKYLDRMMQNDWICAAFALDANVKEAGIKKMFELYRIGDRTPEVVRFIRNRISSHHDDARSSDSKMQEPTPRERSPNPFATCTTHVVDSNCEKSVQDSWDEYNSTFSTEKDLNQYHNESVLQFWKRQDRTNHKLRPLAKIARDVLGVASSSTSVERLFSQSGNVLGHKRGALSAGMLVQQTALRVWTDEGILKQSQAVEVL
ncbi:hypothetical protein QFC22_002519 [Naganishia vaughanmartiniae]|uniref:Uncharacterized protein n=1 Tax=Naganishia vaughanmartiniae TaxID=1424756 RepID=A0ACC2XAJ7_9TREE|nr:hypothetical protein QFC22_002519 [Naganishia vaughanmartiniae]